jgi:hypothetical protein
MLDAWAHERGVKLQFIRPGKPIENAYVASLWSCIGGARWPSKALHESNGAEAPWTPATASFA